jgi:hypothetical protein
MQVNCVQSTHIICLFIGYSSSIIYCENKCVGSVAKLEQAGKLEQPLSSKTGGKNILSE